MPFALNLALLAEKLARNCLLPWPQSSATAAASSEDLVVPAQAKQAVAADYVHALVDALLLPLCANW
jgi:hypothetical protein